MFRVAVGSSSERAWGPRPCAAFAHLPGMVGHPNNFSAIAVMRHNAYSIALNRNVDKTDLLRLSPAARCHYNRQHSAV